jgi:protein-S-isoprenylcysteine O-methyltransferase Ste14
MQKRIVLLTVLVFGLLASMRLSPGPCYHVRHPMYLGAFIFLIAQALVAANWLLLLPAIVTTAFSYKQIGKEEAMLIDRFGDEYREYMKRTPRLIPKPHIKNKH